MSRRHKRKKHRGHKMTGLPAPRQVPPPSPPQQVFGDFQTEPASLDDSPESAPLSRRQRRALEQQGRVQVTAEHYQGPLPHPGMLAHYNEVHPGASGIIFGEFTKQGEHRRDLESRVVRSNVRQALIGQIFAFVILAGIAGGGMFLIYKGKDIAGYGAVATAVSAGLWALGSAKKEKAASLVEKRGKTGNAVQRR